METSVERTRTSPQETAPKHLIQSPYVPPNLPRLHSPTLEKFDKRGKLSLWSVRSSMHGSMMSRASSTGETPKMPPSIISSPLSVSSSSGRTPTSWSPGFRGLAPWRNTIVLPPWYPSNVGPKKRRDSDTSPQRPASVAGSRRASLDAERADAERIDADRISLAESPVQFRHRVKAAFRGMFRHKSMSHQTVPAVPSAQYEKVENKHWAEGTY